MLYSFLFLFVLFCFWDGVWTHRVDDTNCWVRPRWSTRLQFTGTGIISTWLYTKLCFQFCVCACSWVAGFTCPQRLEDNLRYNSSGAIHLFFFWNGVFKIVSWWPAHSRDPPVSTSLELRLHVHHHACLFMWMPGIELCSSCLYGILPTKLSPQS